MEFGNLCYYKPYEDVLMIPRIIFLFCLFGWTVCAQNVITPVSPDTQATWLHHVIPLPHEIAISNQVSVPSSSLVIVVSPNAGDIVKQAASELRDLIKQKAGAAPASSRFEIVLGVVDGDGRLDGNPVAAASRLKTLPHNAQAYVIEPQLDAKLLVAGLNEKGVYYGAQTLRQLLLPYLSADEARIPLATVVDWPDMDERGTWNVSYTLDFMAGLKLNNYRIMSRYKNQIKRDQKAELVFEELNSRRVRAFYPVVSFIHLNFLNEPAYGRWFEAYPELAGKGDKALQKMNPNPDHRVPCASNPLLKKLLADAMRTAASQGAQEFDVWQSEFVSECECDACQKSGKGQMGLEAEASVAAWQEVRRDYPNLVLRIFASVADETPRTAAALKALPPEVKINYVYGPQAPFDDCARQGRWVSHWLVPANQGFETRNLRTAIQTLQTNGWQGINGYSAGPFGLTALAEWSWNLKGRNERELAEAWTTRQGYGDPAKVAEWVELIGPLNAIQLDSSLNSILDTMPGRLATPKQVNHLGWITDRETATAKDAFSRAEKLAIPELVSDAKKALAYFQLIGSINLLWSSLDKDVLNAESKETVKTALAAFIQAAADYRQAYGDKARFSQKWTDAVADAVAKRVAATPGA